MSQYLFLFKIGPVQSYIQQARKTQDLYAGSFILSYLCQTAIKTAQTDGAKLIFPQANTATDSLLNEFLAVVDKDESKLKDFGTKVEDAVKDAFKKIADEAIRSTNASINYDDQISKFLSINWLFVEKDPANYAKSYDEITRLMGAIKNVRTFDQLEETGRKCAICGERNVKFYRKTEKESETNETPWKLSSNDSVHIIKHDLTSPITKKDLQMGEGLCAVCFGKRKAESARNLFKPIEFDADFPSIAEIALMDSLTELRGRYPHLNLKFDKQILFDLENNRDKRKLEKLYDEREIPLAEEALKRLNGKLNDDYKDKPIHIRPYYAVLSFDGDHMGKWLSGDFLKDTTQLEAFHYHISSQLGIFAQKAKDYLNEKGKAEQKKVLGRTVYAGGDDFLGFVNLRHLFTVMQYVRKLFDEIGLTPYTGNKPTFSAGVVIAHYKTPLSEALKWAKKMQSAAKNDLDKKKKDAFTIATLKHSGEIHKATYRWKYDDAILPHFKDIYDLLSGDAFSNTFIHQLDKEFCLLMDADGKMTGFRPQVEIEISRLAGRSCKLKRSDFKDETEYKSKKVEVIDQLVKSMNALNFHSHTFENFLYTLQIIDHMARKVSNED